MYTDHFGLRGQPFQLTPDARFYFESRTHRKAMAYLGYGLAQGEGFIVITGEVGAGKSTLAAHLMATIDRSRLNIIHIVSTQIEGDDMLRLAAQGFGLATEGIAKAQLLERFEQQLEREAQAGKRTLLVVDEAQNLPVSALEELRMLSNFQRGGQALVQIFLLGQPEFREKLNGAERLEQLRQRVIATHHLEAMGEDEIADYIGHRLTLVGWAGKPDFAADSFAALHAHSGGIPRRVNQLASRLLLAAAVEARDTIDAGLVETVASEMAVEQPERRREERVLPFRFPGRPESAAGLPMPDPAIERRLAALEARVEEQEAAVRRVLTVVLDWIEQDKAGADYRTNAA